MGDGEGRVEASESLASVTNVCEIPTEDFLAGPGGYTSREFEGEWYVSEDQYLYTSDFAYCAVHRLDLALAEAERRGIDRTIMERAVDHTALDPDDCPQSSPTSTPEKSESGGGGAGAWPWSALDVATVVPEAAAWEINRRGEEIMRLRAALAEISNGRYCATGDDAAIAARAALAAAGGGPDE